MRSTGFAFGNILRLAAYEQARRALRRECAPDSAQSAERVQLLCRVRQKGKGKRDTHGVSFPFLVDSTGVEPVSENLLI